MFTFYGCGTTLYGKGKPETGDGYIATKWICAFNIPVIPLKSYLVTDTQESMNWLVYQNTRYTLVPQDKLYRRHVMVWGISWLAFFALMVGLSQLKG